MLVRQKIVLALLSQVGKPLSRTAFLKLVFLLREETELSRASTFYDFVPYKHGPFSFSLYRELENLRRHGYLDPCQERVALCQHAADLAEEKIRGLPAAIHEAVNEVLRCHGGKSLSALVRDVYSRYPWYATRSERTDLLPDPLVRPRKARPAVNTVGYEGESVDCFFNRLLKRGIQLIIDVRANPVSRRYGFSKKRFSEIASKLGLGYSHMPELGIPAEYRAELTDYDSYQDLLDMYERERLPRCNNEIDEVADLMRRTPAVLVCLEKDFRCCHRGRLAEAVSRQTGLEVAHL